MANQSYSELVTGGFDLKRIWDNSPIGITIYEPIFDEHGELFDMALIYVNRAVTALANMTPADVAGWHVGQLIGDDIWNSVRERYAEMIETGQSITYARTLNRFGVSFAYQTTAWYSPPYVAVQVREASSDQLSLEASDIPAALRLVEARQQKTVELQQQLLGRRSG